MMMIIHDKATALIMLIFAVDFKATPIIANCARNNIIPIPSITFFRLMSLIPKLLISHKINSITGIKLIPSNLGAVPSTVPVKVKCIGKRVGKIPYTAIDISTIKIRIITNILFFITFIISLLLD